MKHTIKLIIVAAAMLLLIPSCDTTNTGGTPQLTDTVASIATEAGMAWLQAKSGLPQTQIDKIAAAFTEIKAGNWQSAVATIGREALSAYLASQTGGLARSRAGPKPPATVTSDLAVFMGAE